ncbi:hypothetical protein OnM2_092021 [Erysiphe neolycopersici]|uniref:Retrotransposon gag domain-containing protein n=1 Tax=Erysiphe neolycopersici TaxID=212602 RepID=A0A420HC77_9PEZI|nr:hypothetical protein OnM2_092021 [Erysiphe neolycopersici]
MSSDQGNWAQEPRYDQPSEETRNSPRNFEYLDTPYIQSNTHTRMSLDNLPVFDIPPFSGNNQDAARWIFNLKRAFRAAGIVGDIPPDMWVGAIWSGVEGRAIQWMDSAPHLKYVIDLLRRSPHILTREIADRFTEEFEETFRMVAQPETHRSPMEILNDLKQGPLESVMSYFTKSQGVLHQLGVNKTNQLDPNSSTMRSLVIEMITSKFITGLNNDRLRTRSIERGAASAKTLEECFRIIKDVERSIIDERKQMLLQQEAWKSEGFDRILEAPNQVSEVLEDFAQQTFYNNERNHTRFPLPHRTRPVLNSRFAGQRKLDHKSEERTIRTLPAPSYFNNNDQFERSGQGLGILNENPWRGHNQQPLNIQTTGGRYQGPAYNGENPWKGEASWYPRTGDRKGKNKVEEINHQSSHPMVNGTMHYRNVCWRCGNGPNADSPRHDSRQCQYPPLQNWESEVLRSKHQERKEILEIKGSQIGNMSHDSKKPVTNQVVDFDMRRRERYEKAKLPVPYLNDDWKQSDEIEEMSFDELIAMESALGNSDRDANVVDGPLDRYLLDEPMTENLKPLTYFEEGKCEKCREDYVPTEAQILFSAHVVERDSAKRPRTHHNIINDEDIDPLPKQSVGLDEFGSSNGKNRSRRRQVEPLINARIKDGPLDYMKILDRTKVEISLKDLAQMSPAARKHWKHGMSRVNDKRSRRKRRQAEISEVALKSSNEETQTVGSKKEMRAGLLEKSYPSQQTMTYKSFRVNAKVETAIAGTKKIVALDINSTHVDQGADLNLISDYLVKMLRFQTIRLPKPILFGTAEGRLTNATNFTKIRIGVSGVWRCAEALVLPPASGNPCSIILGLPWLFDVCGNLDIPTFTLEIGDITKGEKRVEVQTTRFKLGQNSKLRLMLADQRTIELAKAQIAARDSQSKRTEKHVKFLSESESESDDEESLVETDGSSEDSASSGKDCVAGESPCQNPKINSDVSPLSCQSIVFDYHNLDCYGNPLVYVHGVIPIIETVSPSNADDTSCSKLAAFPTNRRPIVRTLSNDPIAVIKKWFSEWFGLWNV